MATIADWSSKKQTRPVNRDLERKALAQEVQLRDHGEMTAQLTADLSLRMSRAIVRNSGAAVAGYIPVIGDGANVLATGIDIDEYCEMGGVLDAHNRRFGNKPADATHVSGACKAIRKAAERVQRRGR